MFVRLVIAISLIVGLGSTASAEQEPTFVLTVKEPVGGKPPQHKKLTEALQAQESTLKPALLAKTKLRPVSRLAVTAKLEVLADGSVKPSTITVNYRDAAGDITDDSIKTTVGGTFTKMKKLPRDFKGMTVDVSIKILQP